MAATDSSATHSSPYTFQVRRSLRKEQVIEILNAIGLAMQSTMVIQDRRYRILREDLEHIPEYFEQELYIDPSPAFIEEAKRLPPETRRRVLSLEEVDQLLCDIALFLTQSHVEDHGKDTSRFTLNSARLPLRSIHAQNIREKTLFLLNLLSETPEIGEEFHEQTLGTLPIEIADAFKKENDPIKTWPRFGEFIHQLSIEIVLDEKVVRFKTYDNVTISFQVIRDGLTNWMDNVWTRYRDAEPVLPARVSFARNKTADDAIDEVDIEVVTFIDEKLREWIDEYSKKRHEQEAGGAPKRKEKEEPEEETIDLKTAEADLTDAQRTYRQQSIILERLLIPQLVNLSLQPLLVNGVALSFEDIQRMYPDEYRELQYQLFNEIRRIFQEELTDDQREWWNSPEGRLRLTALVVRRILITQNAALAGAVYRIRDQECTKRSITPKQKDALEEDVSNLVSDEKRLTTFLHTTGQKVNEEYDGKLEGMVDRAHQLTLNSKQFSDILKQMGLSPEQEQNILNGLDVALYKKVSAEELRHLTPQQFYSLFGFAPSPAQVAQLSFFIASYYDEHNREKAAVYRNLNLRVTDSSSAQIIFEHEEDLEVSGLTSEQKQVVMGGLGLVEREWSAMGQMRQIGQENFGGADRYLQVLSFPGNRVPSTQVADLSQFEAAREYLINQAINQFQQSASYPGDRQVWGDWFQEDPNRLRPIDMVAQTELGPDLTSTFETPLAAGSSFLSRGAHFVGQGFRAGAQFQAARTAATLLKGQMLRSGAALAAAPIPVVGQALLVSSFIPPKLRKYIPAFIGGGLGLLFTSIPHIVSMVGNLAGNAVNSVLGGGSSLSSAPSGGASGISKFPRNLAAHAKASLSALATGGPTASAIAGVGGLTTLVVSTVVMTSAQQAAFLPPTLTTGGGVSKYVNMQKTATQPTGNPSDITYNITVSAKPGYNVTINDISDQFEVAVNKDKRQSSEPQTLTPDPSPVTQKSINAPVTLDSTHKIQISYTEHFGSEYHDTGVTNTLTIHFDVKDQNGTSVETGSDATTDAFVCFGSCPVAPIAQKSLAIVQGLQRGWWGYYNYHPKYPDLFSYTLWAASGVSGPPCPYSNNGQCPVYKGGNDPADLFWCTWNVIFAFKDAGHPIPDLTNVTGMRDYFEKYIYFPTSHSFSDKVTVDQIKPGDVAFFGTNNADGITENGHVAIVGEVTPSYIKTYDSDNWQIINTYSVASDNTIVPLTNDAHVKVVWLNGVARLQ